MDEQRDKSVPRKHHADYSDRAKWDRTKTRTDIEWYIALPLMEEHEDDTRGEKYQ